MRKLSLDLPLSFLSQGGLGGYNSFLQTRQDMELGSEVCFKKAPKGPVLFQVYLYLRSNNIADYLSTECHYNMLLSLWICRFETLLLFHILK